MNTLGNVFKSAVALGTYVGIVMGCGGIMGVAAYKLGEIQGEDNEYQRWVTAINLKQAELKKKEEEKSEASE